MIVSVVIILIFGIMMRNVFGYFRMPALIGYLCIGMLFGPFVFDILSEDFLAQSDIIKKLALIIILIRAGFTLKMEDLKKVGSSAILMTFLPASVEIFGAWLVGISLLKLSTMDSLILGTIIAAVSPAVVVPRMVEMIEKHQGTAKGIPQMILAGASADDIYVLVLFSALIAGKQSGNLNGWTLLQVPITIILGVFLGILGGKILSKIVSYVNLNGVLVTMLLIGISLGLMVLETRCNSLFSAYMAILFLAWSFKRELPIEANAAKYYYDHLWLVAELFLFVVVGASLNIIQALNFGWAPLLFVIITSLFRMAGVYLSLLPSPLNKSEKIFIMGAYLPKATVQAAIGSIPLSLGFPSGPLILTVAVLEILMTAPIGALWIDREKNHLLNGSHDEG